MRDLDIKSKCSINTNKDADTFVGIRSIDGDISINFPLGYQISQDDQGIRKDIMLLFSVLAANTDRKESDVLGKANTMEDNIFPIQAYLYIISDYYARGYYKEQEVQYTVSKKGKINWNRTIKTQKPNIQGEDVFYLNFVTKKTTVNEHKLITLIHEYCVYESFDKIGWLFTKTTPAKPRIKYNYKVFLSTIKEKLLVTFNDRNKTLFRNLLAVINYQGDKEANRNYRYGTCRFEYIWERMINKVFGIDNKSDYFPKTMWRLEGVKYDNASLEPDTIMVLNNSIYVLDAKYYKFGVTKRPGDLPKSTSINKQITYGEYIAKERCDGNAKVYNAFIMPFNSFGEKWKVNDEMIWIGEAVSNWKFNDEAYQKVQGILLDVKHLMNINIHQDQHEIMKLARLIENAINKG